MVGRLKRRWTYLAVGSRCLSCVLGPGQRTSGRHVRAGLDPIVHRCDALSIPDFILT